MRLCSVVFGISLLNLGPIDAVAAPFPDTLGNFYIGKYGPSGSCDGQIILNVEAKGIRVHRAGKPDLVYRYDGFSMVNQKVEPPTDPSQPFSANLAHPGAPYDAISDGTDETALEFYERGPGILTFVNNAPPKFHDRSRAALRSLYNVPFRRCGATQSPTLSSPHASLRDAAGAGTQTMGWRLAGGSAVYGYPESTALAKVTCTRRGILTLQFDDPGEAVRGRGTKVARILADSAFEDAAYKIVSGDGDAINFDIHANGVVATAMATGGTIRVGFPNGRSVPFGGPGLSRSAGKVVATCRAQTIPIGQFDIPAERSGPRKPNNNDGWWVVLASGPDTPDRHTNGGLAVDRAAARCGVRTFNDHSGKFIGFREVYSLHVLLGSPFGTRQVAEQALRLATPCFPDAYVRQGTYLGE